MPINDLLPIPSGTNKPTAYDVFGLPAGEPDMERITAAVVATIERLKLVQDQTDPSQWQRAARMVDQARQILADPKRKAALDTNLREASTTHSTPQGIDPPGDPLQGLLPTGNPLEPVARPTVAPGFKSVEMPTGLFGAPAQPASIVLPPGPSRSISPTENAGPIVPTVVPSERRSRRSNRSAAGNWWLGLLTLGLLAVTGFLTYFVFYGPGQIEIVKQGDKITISTDLNPSPKPVINPPQSPNDNRPPKTAPHDPVMGGLASPRNVDDRSLFDTGANVDDQFPPEPAVPMPTLLEEAEPNSEPPMESATSPAQADPPMMNAAIQVDSLQHVRNLIRDADWNQMKVAAEALTRQQLSDENRIVADALYELADLATYYRGGIVRAVAELQVGNDFEVIDSFRVIVVETGDDLLTVRYNKQNRTFTFNEFPFSLAHQLATFQVPDGPTRQAAKAVYQAIAPRSTEAYRDQAIRWLREIDGEVQDADPNRLIQTIESIFPISEQ